MSGSSDSSSTNSSSDECSNNYDSCDEHLEGSNIGEDVAGGCYQNEPEYTKEEVKVMMKDNPHFSDSETDSDDSEAQSSRLENLAWCKCYECVIGDTFVLDECMCCHEFNLLAEKLETNKCITKHEDFKMLMLNPKVLEVSFVRHRRHKRIYKRITQMTNKQLRYTAYRQYTAWSHYFETLGKNVRVVVPSCVVKEIRNAFPEASGKYVGFKRFKDI
ncbi:P2X purinoceptor 7-like [Clytia hemisphaerica]|uniref:P2X purinoceptor 7-like n=1 Tax=Clytia hemisphaerica TaxID=252671 RepID=UPI0034D5A549